MALAIMSFTWVFLLDPGDYFFYMLVCFSSGLALGAEMALPPSILAEYISSDGGRSSAAKKYSGLTMLSKLSLAISAGVCLSLLGYVGFVAGGINTEGALQMLVFLYGAVPSLLKLIALLVTQRWIYIEKTRNSHVQIKTFTTVRGVPDV